jgi:TRAP-type C4-dicarboxylate transport system, large permease component
MDAGTIGIIIGLVLLVILGSGLWVAMALFGVGFFAISIFSSSPAGAIMATTSWGQSWSWSLTALPLFIWMGEILFRTRLAEDMFRGLSPWMSKIPGGLMHVNVVGSGIFAAVSGSSAATTATIGRITIPELAKRGYDDKMTLGTLAGSATLGLLIPPSIILIVYGVAADVSISRLFIAGILPGLVLIGLFMATIMIWALVNPEKTPPAEPAMTIRQKLKASGSLIPILMLIIGVIGSIYTGIATATEAAAVWCCRSFVLIRCDRFHELGQLPRKPDGCNQNLMHDCVYTCWRRFFVCCHGLYRHTKRIGRMDPRLRTITLNASAGAYYFLCGLGVFSRWYFYRGTYRRCHHAHDRAGWHRFDLVWHLYRCGGGNEPNYPANRAKPICHTRLNQ